MFNFFPEQKIIYQAKELRSEQIKTSALSTLPRGYYFNTDASFAPIQGIRGFLGVRWNLF
jgi:hypothetical protein